MDLLNDLQQHFDETHARVLELIHEKAALGAEIECLKNKIERAHEALISALLIIRDAHPKGAMDETISALRRRAGIEEAR